MGGGASLMEGLEEMVATTILIGRAISAMTFPGMYRIYDFHSKKAPRLKNARNFTFFAPDSEEDDDDNEMEEPPDPSAYSHFFKVVVNGDEIYIEDPTKPNEDGWTALHTCCMSLSTVNAALELIEETIRLGGSLDTKTLAGPGTFNKGWTPLQMACAYGVDPVVEKLVQSGADVNSANCYGYSCMLEACHRGFADITRSLLKGRVDLSYIPDPKAAIGSPFTSAPPQSALGEAARCGFYKMVQMLIDAGADKDQANYIGWTPLHEACFYHRIETVKTLLLAGADPTLRTNQNALPYHLTGLNEIRKMLEEMGGPKAVPEDGDTVDMVKVLTELTMSENEDIDPSELESGRQPILISGGMGQMPIMVVPFRNFPTAEDAKALTLEDQKENSSPIPHRIKEKREEEKFEEKSEYLHHGQALGHLPALTPSKTSPSKNNPNNDVDAALQMDRQKSGGAILGSPTDKVPKVSKKADDKTKKPKKTKEEIPADMPREYLCQLTQKPMSDPVKTIYGNVYDKAAIYNWFSQQGRICPLTGAPLAEIDLIPMPELGNEIRQWILKKSLKEENESVSKREEIKNTQTDDLYDFN